MGAYHLSELDGLIGLPANLTRQFCQSKRATHDLIALKKGVSLARNNSGALQFLSVLTTCTDLSKVASAILKVLLFSAQDPHNSVSTAISLSEDLDTLDKRSVAV